MDRFAYRRSFWAEQLREEQDWQEQQDREYTQQLLLQVERDGYLRPGPDWGIYSEDSLFWPQSQPPKPQPPKPLTEEQRLKRNARSRAYYWERKRRKDQELRERKERSEQLREQLRRQYNHYPERRPVIDYPDVVPEWEKTMTVLINGKKVAVRPPVNFRG